MGAILMFNLRSLWSNPRGPSERNAAPPAPPRFRPQLEGFEDRTVPAAPVLGPAIQAPVAPAAAADLINITGVQLTNFQIVDNVLKAAGTVTGTLAGLPFTANITNFALQLIPDNPSTPAEECSVLHLELAPIHLSLLGLHVDTSRICLDITATEGGGLLGDLLCSLAGGSPLGTGLPVIPTGSDLTGLLGGLTDILNGILGGGNAQPGGGGSDVCTGDNEILHLVLGPLNLSLLGLNVSLDNCAGGPVEVCVSASRGEGILGDLLSGLSGRGRGLNLDLNEVTQIVNLVSDLNADGAISGRDIGQLTSTLNHLKK